ncbi:UdgX family uracil-DNA binding protein [Streptomyces johnsoniae]|uniref:Type-4 uracil-DNA glycosylase n=1 Tax=Streptomyces johnsoniae TaxID=3075532 RepID=A0ABU2SA04_9ACTN|nr:UdgX family uracil-DNA binding protein [Streptomyces sp. DSM 41886]MDT0445802.1 UdgX family uracil-DNA binding protein [Streptomyces sp. DSM 41886]
MAQRTSRGTERRPPRERSGPDAYDAGPYLPDGEAGLPALRRAAAGCEGCPLHADATRTVFGAGAPRARVMLVGEEPGDQEDRRGEPFVGPAGRLLTRAVEEAGLDPDQTYVTNAVKHFKFTRAGSGKRRIHKPPTLRELTACKPWLRAELREVGPEVVVALGASAGKALRGSSFRVTKERGVPLPLELPDGERVLVATIHPSAVLRAGEDRDAVYGGLVADLRVAAETLGAGGP